VAELDNQKLDQIIDLLQQLVTVTKNPSGITVEERPWSFRLLQELASGEDADGNNMVYGHDFIFNQVIDWHPPALQSSADSLTRTFKGNKRITFIEYAQSLPVDDVKIEKILDFVDSKKQLNG